MQDIQSKKYPVEVESKGAANVGYGKGLIHRGITYCKGDNCLGW